jgi:hypothetical protein
MNKAKKLTPEQVAIRKARRLEAMHLQIIEGNPLDAEDIAMFEMFEREAWPGRTLPRIRDGSRARDRKKSKKQS